MTIILLSLIKCNHSDFSADIRIVSNIDHIVIRTNSIAEIDQINTLFKDTLDFPEWFELRINEKVNEPVCKFYNSGVYLGNVFLEFITFKTEDNEQKPRGADLYAISLVSDMDNLFGKITNEEIEKFPKHYFDHLVVKNSGNSIDTLFTNVILENFTTENILFFFTRYHPGAMKNRNSDSHRLNQEPNDLDQYCKEFKSRFNKCHGGNLGVIGVKELQILTPKFKKHLKLYHRIFSSEIEKEEGYWKFKQGPAIRLEKGDVYKVGKMVVEVQSLPKAAEFLKAHNLLGETTERSMLMATDSKFDLKIEIVEK
jgi:hypothetical protein